MTKRITLVLGIVLLVASGFTSIKKAPFVDPELLHYWNFNEINFLEPNLGGGAISFDLSPTGAVVSDPATNQGFAAANARNGDEALSHLRANNPIGTLLRFNFSTADYEAIVVKYETRRSGSGAGTQRIFYTLNGVDYTELTTIGVTETPAIVTLDFSAVEGSEDNENFGIRIEFEATGGGSGGNNRIDNFTVEGSAIPQIQLAHYWNFNEVNFLEPNLGGGAISFDLSPTGAVVSDPATNQGFAAANARNGDEALSHLRANNPIGTLLRFNFSTADYEAIVVKYETRRSGSGAGTQRIFYTLNGVDYTELTTIGVTETPAIVTLDFSAVEGSEDNENFGIRIEFEATGGGSGGNNRIDNFTVDGIFTGASDPVLTDPVVLANPADEEADLVLKPTFTWETLVDASSYDVQVSKEDNFNTTVVDVSRSVTDLTLSSQLEVNTIYYWHVRGRNSSGEGPWSETRSFTTIESFPGSSLRLNEVMASNNGFAQDEDGDNSDWVEIYNTGGDAVDLNGFGLSDDPSSPYKWSFPAVTIQPHEFLLVWASNKNRTVPGSPLHASYAISAGGETITITNVEGIAIDQYPAPAMTEDIAWGRFPDGTGGWTMVETPTPEGPNSEGSLPLSATVTFSHNSGFYEGEFDLDLTTSEGGATILYTLDGSTPDDDNLVGTTYQYKNTYPESPGEPFGEFLENTFQTLTFSAPLHIVDRSEEPNKISNITTGVGYLHKPDPVHKATVVKARVYKPGFSLGPVTTHTFFIGDREDHSLPIFSYSVDEDLLFDYNKGMYVPGVDFDNWRVLNPNGPPNGWNPANYQRDIEVPASIQFFERSETTATLNQDITSKLSGHYSLSFPSKSLRLEASGDGGQSSFNYKFFDDRESSSFNNLILRNGGNDFPKALFRDAAGHRIVANLKIGTQAYRPAALYINGEYWGATTLRERIDEDFLANHYNVDPGNVDLIESRAADEGDIHRYEDMEEYFTDNDAKDSAVFANIEMMMDTESFIDYQAAEIFSANTDWPGNNVVLWRTRNEFNPNGDPYSDGRFRWIFKDTDFGWGQSTGVTFNAFPNATDPNGPGWPNPPWSTLFLRKCLENPGFKTKFINRFADLLNTTFEPVRLTGIVNDVKVELEDEIPAHVERWNMPLHWSDEVVKTINFVTLRAVHQREHIVSYFGLAGIKDLTVDVDNPSHGFIHVNTIDILPTTDGISFDPYPWTGKYFDGVPVKIKAIALPGYEFSHWEGTDTPDKQELTVYLTDNLSLKAIFVETHIFRLAPAHQSVEVPVNTAFTWAEGSSNDVYVLQVATDEEFNALVFEQGGLTAETFEPASALEEARTYFWRLRFDAEGEENNWTTSWTFRTPVEFPGRVELGGPLESDKTTLGVRFHWTEATTAENYHFQLSEQADFASLMVDRTHLTESEIGVTTGLVPGKQYFWRARGVNSRGNGAWSSAKFTTLTFPTVPVLTAPAAGAISVEQLPTFSWEAVVDVDLYSLQISKAADFSTIVETLSVGNITRTLEAPLEHSTTYYWRVKALNGIGSSDWSEARSFTTVIIHGLNDGNLAAAVVAYPNPVTDKLRLIVPDNFKVRSLHLIDAVGKSSSLAVANEIDFSDKAPGVFFLKITGAMGETATLKVMKVQ